MKKTYIIPTTNINTINVERMVADSDPTENVTLDRNSTPIDPNDFDAKSSTHSYNVWDDDWSK